LPPRSQRERARIGHPIDEPVERPLVRVEWCRQLGRGHNRGRRLELPGRGNISFEFKLEFDDVIQCRRHIGDLVVGRRIGQSLSPEDHDRRRGAAPACRR
jgi:hypothetical protein